METCATCGKEATISPTYSGYAYCPEHFRVLIERRVRRDLRVHNPLDVRREYVFLDDGSPLSSLCLELLESIFSGRLRLRKDAEAPLGPEVIVPSCLDSYASELLESFLGRAEAPVGIHPLRSVMAQDARALGFPVECDPHPLLRSLEEAQPGACFGILRSCGEREEKKRE